MNHRRGRARGALLALLLLPALLFLPAAIVRTQTTAALGQNAAGDVVMLALQALTPRAELNQHIEEGLLSDSPATRDVEKHLLEIQMIIVQETATFGPVLLLAPDETTRTALYQRCAEWRICELLRSDRVRVKVVVHDGLWLRDFGPRIELAGDAAHVVHWRYFDIRTEQAKREKLEELETARLRLLEARQQADQPETLAPPSAPDARRAAAAAIDAKLYVLREFSQLLSEISPQRTNDDNSAFDVADAVLAAPDFAYTASALALDGGNLFKLEDGRCLTTRVLLSRNKDQSINVDQELRQTAGCTEVTYLEPLPGPVIEHVDMFALPAAGKRILLASYSLSQPFAAEYWSKLSDAERDLAANAELAMEQNAERLRRLGYDVVPVPSPFPRVPADGHIYYPSVLNVLVRNGPDGAQQIIAPLFKDYETDIQSAAARQIANAFGTKAKLVTIEATTAAKSQGGIHCLTLTAPLQLSVFGDSADLARRASVLAAKEKLDRQVATQTTPQIPENGLQGSWAILGDTDATQASLLYSYPQRIFFGKEEFQRGVLDQVEAQGQYSVDKRETASWSLHLLFRGGAATPATVQWITKDEVRLTLGDARALLLRRISSSATSPFKPAD